MPMMQLGSVPLRVLAFRRQRDEVGGGPERTVSGQLRGTPFWTARNWSATVRAATDAEADAIREQADGATVRVLSGGAFVTPINVITDVDDDVYQRVPNSEDWRRVLTLNVRESLTT